MFKKFFWGIFLFVVLFIIQDIFSSVFSHKHNFQKVVHIYNWADFIAPEIIKDFEKETGIAVVYDVYDNNEVLEAKLLMGKTGYDLVFPSAWPYFERLKEARVFRKIDRSKIKNISLVDPLLLKKLESIDPGKDYGIPYLWGTSGFGYDYQKIKALLGDDIDHSWSALFSSKNLKKLSSCGVVLMDVPVELFPAYLKSMNINPNSEKIEDLNMAVNHILSIRKYIRKFSSSAGNDLASGECCLIQSWSADVRLARDKSKQASKNLDIRYIIPKEGASLWVDIMAIPEDAPNAENAHLFIDFLLRPENMAKITNYIYCANSVPSSQKFIEPQILNDRMIYHAREDLEKTYTDRLFSASFERLRNRAMMKIKTGK